VSQDEAVRETASLFASWYSCLVRYLYRATRSLEFSEDMAQEAFLQLYRALCRGEKVQNAKGWTLCVARREIIRTRHRDAYERSKREPLDVLEMLPAGRVGGEVLPFEWDALGRLMSVLTQREEEVLLLRVEGLKYREIAFQLGISSNSVSTLVARALRKMRRTAHATSRTEAISTDEKHVENGFSKPLQ
jgi:RNA polymerase sigma-70 factor (ECF subfamily)